MKKHKIIINCFVALIVVLFGIIYVQHLSHVYRYQHYNGETIGTVCDIEMTYTYVNSSYVPEYMVSYRYTVEDENYENESSWMTETDLDKLMDGSEVTVKFNEKHPADSMLECDKNSHVSFVVSFAVFTVLIILWACKNKRRNK